MTPNLFVLLAWPVFGLIGGRIIYCDFQSMRHRRYGKDNRYSHLSLAFVIFLIGPIGVLCGLLVTGFCSRSGFWKIKYQPCFACDYPKTYEVMTDERLRINVFDNIFGQQSAYLLTPNP